MRNAGLDELGARNLEAETPVEPGSIGLCVQARARMAAVAGLLHQGLQHERTRALAAPLLQHRHAPDVAIGQQATRRHRGAIGGIGKRMVATRVLIIRFKRPRHALFAHEHQLAYAARFGAGLVPVAQADGERLRRHGGYNTRLH